MRAYPARLSHMHRFLTDAYQQNLVTFARLTYLTLHAHMYFQRLKEF